MGPFTVTCMYMYLDKGVLNLRESAGTWEDLELMREYGGNNVYVFLKIKKSKLFCGPALPL